MTHWAARADADVRLSFSSSHPRLIARSSPTLYSVGVPYRRTGPLIFSPGLKIARPEIQIDFVRSAPDALSFDHAVVSHVLQTVFDARRLPHFQLLPKQGNSPGTAFSLPIGTTSSS
jgi:hypothetical protein